MRVTDSTPFLPLRWKRGQGLSAVLVTVPGSREGECAILDIPGGHGSGYVSLARQATEPASAAETEELRRLLVQYKYPSPYPVRRFSAAHRKELRIAYRRMIAELDHPDVLTPKEQGK